MGRRRLILGNGGRKRYDGEARTRHFPVASSCDPSQSYKSYGGYFLAKTTRGKNSHLLTPWGVNLRHSLTLQWTSDTRSELW